MYSRRRISQIVEGESNQVLHNSDLGNFGHDSIADVKSFGSRIKGNLKHQKCKLKLRMLYFFLKAENKISTSRSAKAALHKCPGKSSLNVNHFFLSCLPSMSCLTCLTSPGSCQMTSQMACLTSLNGHNCNWKLEVVHLQVGCCL